jgi:hypothetical protein
MLKVAWQWDRCFDFLYKSVRQRSIIQLLKPLRFSLEFAEIFVIESRLPVSTIAGSRQDFLWYRFLKNLLIIYLRPMYLYITPFVCFSILSFKVDYLWLIRRVDYSPTPKVDNSQYNRYRELCKKISAGDFSYRWWYGESATLCITNTQSRWLSVSTMLIFDYEHLGEFKAKIEKILLLYMGLVTNWFTVYKKRKISLIAMPL